VSTLSNKPTGASKEPKNKQASMKHPGSLNAFGTIPVSHGDYELADVGGKLTAKNPKAEQPFDRNLEYDDKRQTWNPVGGGKDPLDLSDTPLPGKWGGNAEYDANKSPFDPDDE
jgi:hypothetical protein